MDYMEAMKVLSAADYVPPTSDENVTVTDTEFSNVPVRLFVPRRASDGLRRAVLFFHGGGWCLGDAGELLPVSAGLCGDRDGSCWALPFVSWALPRRGRGAGVAPARSSRRLGKAT